MIFPIGDALAAQYRDATNLNARIRLHDRFSTNPRGWHQWVFDHLLPSPGSRVLELGCGTGDLWSRNTARVPEAWEIVLSDRFPGMLMEAERNLSGGRRFRFAIVDAQAIPFADQSFDEVIANHMLYHVPDRARALSEIRRVLRPGGHFYAATSGEHHLRELFDLINRFADEPVAGQDFAATFSLENGAAQIGRWFPRVTLHRYDDALIVTEAEPLVAYLLSGMARSVLSSNRLPALIRFVNERIALEGAIRITKDSGLFEAWEG